MLQLSNIWRERVALSRGQLSSPFLDGDGLSLVASQAGLAQCCIQGIQTFSACSLLRTFQVGKQPGASWLVPYLVTAAVQPGRGPRAGGLQ